MTITLEAVGGESKVTVRQEGIPKSIPEEDADQRGHQALRNLTRHGGFKQFHNFEHTGIPSNSEGLTQLRALSGVSPSCENMADDTRMAVLGIDLHLSN
ncbi:hypothetical protein ACFFQF_16290 [Haladaptatus pallidirubidus]|uniref:Transposase n=1 Tax=Haladaptatus pallidirubidus TaxID=1008152 RepID=A0AAV3US12_9EURY|nr:hypothetical protein [Haladaptatus pallidirubidus]